MFIDINEKIPTPVEVRGRLKANYYDAQDRIEIVMNFSSNTIITVSHFSDYGFAAIPEISTWALLGTSLLTLVIFRRRKVS